MDTREQREHQLTVAGIKLQYVMLHQRCKVITFLTRKLHSDHQHWISFPAMSAARARAAHFSNGRILIIAGGEGVGNLTLSSAEMYSDGKWSKISDMPAATSG